MSYPSERAANTALNTVRRKRVYQHGVRKKSWHNKQGHKDKMPRRAYQCPECQQWHLTSQADAELREFDEFRQTFSEMKDYIHLPTGTLVEAILFTGQKPLPEGVFYAVQGAFSPHRKSVSATANEQFFLFGYESPAALSAKRIRLQPNVHWIIQHGPKRIVVPALAFAKDYTPAVELVNAPAPTAPTTPTEAAPPYLPLVYDRGTIPLADFTDPNGTFGPCLAMCFIPDVPTQVNLLYPSRNGAHSRARMVGLSVRYALDCVVVHVVSIGLDERRHPEAGAVTVSNLCGFTHDDLVAFVNTRGAMTASLPAPPPQSKKWHKKTPDATLLALLNNQHPYIVVYGIFSYSDPQVERVNAPALIVQSAYAGLRKLEFTWEAGGWLISHNTAFAPDRLPACAVVESTFPAPMTAQRLYAYFQGKTY